MCLKGCYLELQLIEDVFLYTFNGNSFISSVWVYSGFLLNLLSFFVYLSWNITLWDYFKAARVIE
jgi:hypothetical protein